MLDPPALLPKNADSSDLNLIHSELAGGIAFGVFRRFVGLIERPNRGELSEDSFQAESNALLQQVNALHERRSQFAPAYKDAWSGYALQQ